jgi:hypothetical protein
MALTFGFFGSSVRVDAYLISVGQGKIDRDDMPILALALFRKFFLRTGLLCT